jgi:hypothetical protein
MARDLGRKGGRTTAAARRRVIAPYADTVLDLADAAGLVGASWMLWRAVLKVIFALPVALSEATLLAQHTARDIAHAALAFVEAWIVAGRRGGKSRVAALVGLFKGISFDAARLAPGELAVVVIIAADRKQGRVVLKYLKGMCALPEVAPYVHRVLKESVELRTGVNIEVHTASYRTIRGYTVVAAVLDEVSFWRDETTSTNPDSEILDALRPGMATVPDALLFAISSPYGRRGALWSMYDRYYGQGDPHVLVVNADTKALNPTVPDHIIARAFDEDPVAAASEYGQGGHVEFRRDVEAYVDAVAIAAVTVAARREVPPASGTAYVAFCDPSGGSQDSFALAVAHRDGKDRAVLDAVRSRRPPFSPDAVVEEFAALLAAYGVGVVRGDHYAGEWPRESFRRHGITYVPSERTKSDLYRELLAPLNAGRVELLDVPTLRAQLVGLERRVGRSGKDSIDHAPGGHDDLANAAAGALVNALPLSGKKVVQWSSMAPRERAASVAAGIPAPAAPPKPGNRGTAHPMEGYADAEEPGFVGEVRWSSSASPAFRRATGGE